MGPRDRLEVMLGIPAHANSNQRFLTLEAFRRAGFDVIGMLQRALGGRHRIRPPLPQGWTSPGGASMSWSTTWGAALSTRR